MGVVKTITHDNFPKQGSFLGLEVKVIYHYDTSKSDTGIVVRDDAEDPWVVIILLDNGRYVLSTECQYSLIQ